MDCLRPLQSKDGRRVRNRRPRSARFIKGTHKGNCTHTARPATRRRGTQPCSAQVTTRGTQNTGREYAVLVISALKVVQRASAQRVPVAYGVGCAKKESPHNHTCMDRCGLHSSRTHTRICALTYPYAEFVIQITLRASPRGSGWRPRPTGVIARRRGNLNTSCITLH